MLSLTPVARAPILGSLGRPAQAWFLNQVTRQRASWGEELHRENSRRPYTVSTLLDDRGRPLRSGSWLEPGKSVWLRLTTFSTNLSGFVLEKVLPRLPNNLELYKMTFRLDGYTLEPAQHPWACSSSFSALVQDTRLGSVDGRVRLEFASPTAFRSQGADIPLPDPARLMKSYWTKWNQVVPHDLQIQDIWPNFAGECVVVNELSGINTERWTFAEGARGWATGYTGAVGLVLLGKKQCKEWADHWDGAAAVLHLLARFALFCGTGHHTTIGMGQTRSIPLPSTPLS